MLRNFLLALCFCVGLRAHAQELWSRFAGPSGGSVRDIAMWNNAGISLGTQSFVTSDDGNSWNAVSLQIEMTSCATDSRGRAWVSTDSNGTFITKNFGTDWFTLLQTSNGASGIWKFITTEPGTRIAIHSDSLGHTAHHVIFESIDPNENFSVVKNMSGLPQPFLQNDLTYNHFTHSLVLSFFDSTNSRVKIFKSTDLGDSWLLLAMQGIPSDESITSGANAIVCTNDGNEFLSTITHGGSAVQLKNYGSTDDGASWSQLSIFPPANIALRSEAQDSNGILFATAFMQMDSVTKRFSTIYQSTDSGAHWLEVPHSGLPPQWAEQLLITPAGTMLASSNSEHAGGIYRSNDHGATWTLSNDRMNRAPATHVAVDSANHLFAWLPSSGLWRTIDGGASWLHLQNGIPAWGDVIVRVAADSSLFAADSTHEIFHSTDEGDSWSDITNNLPIITINAFDISRNGVLLVASSAGIFRSTNDGTFWTPATNSIPENIFVNQFGVRADGIIFAATASGPFRSTDDGNTWSVSTNGLSTTSSSSIGFTNAGDVLLGNADGIMRSSDDGIHWKNSGSGLLHDARDNHPITSIAKRFNERLIVARPNDSVAIYFSSDDGNSWHDDRTGNLQTVHEINFVDLTCDKFDDLFAASNRGVWLAPPQPAAVAESNYPDILFLLRANPNPAQNFTTLRFSTSATTTATLRLVDMLGRVALQTEKLFSVSGEQQMPINISSLRSGMYRVVLQANDITKSILFGVTK